MADEDIQRICDTFLAFEETEQSKIFRNAALGYWKVTVQPPLRLRVDLTPDRLKRFASECDSADLRPLGAFLPTFADELGEGPHFDFTEFLQALELRLDEESIRLPAKAGRLVRDCLAQRDEAAKPVIRKRTKLKRGEQIGHEESIRGRYQKEYDDVWYAVEYEPDPDLRDTEQVPLLEAGGIDAFLEREVLPHAPDAWYDLGSVKIGYEISFTRYFYKPQPMRTLEEIRTDILALKRETEGLLDEIIGKA